MNSLLESWNDPHARHAMLVHLPIVLGALGALPVLALLLTRMRSRSLQWVCAAVFVLASSGAWLASNAGEDAEHALNEGAMSPAAKQTLERHEQLGETGWLWPLIPLAALGGAAVIKKKRVKVALGGVTLVAAVGVGVWVSMTAHEGGRLVYVHGVGVPGGAGQSSAEPGNGAHGDDASDDASDDDDAHSESR